MRRSTLLAIIAVSILASACSQSALAPRRDDPPPNCHSGYQDAGGHWICE